MEEFREGICRYIWEGAFLEGGGNSVSWELGVVVAARDQGKGTFAAGTLSQLYGPGDIQNFANGIGPVSIQEAGFPVLGALPWSLSKTLSLLDAISGREGDLQGLSAWTRTRGTAA